jgi:hypothetical protein
MPKTKILAGIAFLAFGIIDLITAFYTLRAYDIAIENNVEHELVMLAPTLYKILIIFGVAGVALFGLYIGLYAKSREG